MTNQQRQMLECHLAAPTLSGRPETSPTLTNLDRETVYQLKLRKLQNDELDQFNKLEEDQLLVSIRLGFKSDCLPEGITERELFLKWKEKHPTERLFDIESDSTHSEPNSSGSNTQYLENLDQDGFIDVASCKWNAGKEVQLGIVFHCVSSQFPFVRYPTWDVNPVFVLHVNISSQNVTNWIYYFVCEIKLFWPGRSIQANHRVNLQPHFPTESENSEQTIPSCPYTIMKLTTMNRDKRALLSKNFPIQTEEENSHILYQIPEDYAEIGQINDSLENYFGKLWNFVKKHSILWSKKQDSFKYAPRYPRDLFVDSCFSKGSTIGYYKGFFYHRGDLFTIDISKNGENQSKVLNGQVVKTTIVLDLNHRKFDKEEIFDWKVGKLFEMIDLDYHESTFMDSILDIRQIETNCIEIYWIPPKEFQLKLSFRFSCLSNEFEFGNNLNLFRDQIGPAFLLSISSVLLSGPKCELETVHCRLYSVDNSARTVRSDWLERNILCAQSSDLQIHPIIILNQNLLGYTEIHRKNVLIVSTVLLFTYFCYRKCRYSVRQWRIDRLNRAMEMKAKLERLSRLQKEKVGNAIFKRKLAPDELGAAVGLGTIVAASFALAWSLFDFSK